MPPREATKQPVPEHEILRDDFDVPVLQTAVAPLEAAVTAEQPDMARPARHSNRDSDAGRLLLMPAEIRSWNGVTKASTELWRADSLRGRFARGAVWSLIGAVISQGSNLAASVITARLLGRLQFGEYGMIQSTVGMLGIFAGLGLGVTGTKYVAEFRSRDPERAGRIVALGCAVAMASGGLLAVGLAIYAPLLAARTLNAPALATELRAASVLLFFNAVNGAQTGALSGLEAFRAIARINMARGFITFPITVGLVVLWRLPGAVWALAVTAAVTCLLCELSLRHHCAVAGIRPRFSRAWRERRVLWAFSMPAFLSGALVGPVTWAVNTMLLNQPGGYAEMGVFSAASQWRTAVAFLPALLSQPLLSILSNVGATDRQSFRRLLRANIFLAFGLSSCIAAPIVLCASWIMRVYGPGFTEGRPILILLVLAAVISVTAGVIGQAIVSLDRMWWGLTLNLVWAVVTLTAAALLVPRYGALGLALAFLGSYMVHALTVSAYAYVHLRSRWVRLEPTARSVATSTL